MNFKVCHSTCVRLCVLLKVVKVDIQSFPNSLYYNTNEIFITVIIVTGFITFIPSTGVKNIPLMCSHVVLVR